MPGDITRARYTNNTRKRYNMLQLRMKGQGMKLKIKGIEVAF